MHLLLTISLFVAAVWKGDWRHWQKYHLTIFYVVICDLLYNLLCQNHLLWRYRPHLIPDSHILVELMYAFINLPALTLLYLSHYPNSTLLSKQARYILTWIVCSLIVEYPFYRFQTIKLQHGYHFWMEPFFYLSMFSMIRLHQTKPFLTYGISGVVILFMLHYFHVPIK